MGNTSTMSGRFSGGRRVSCWLICEARWSGLASELRFEEAQELKEQYQKVERYQAKSVIVNPSLDSVDVFGIDDDGSNDVYINYMHVRRGAVAVR